MKRKKRLHSLSLPPIIGNDLGREDTPVLFAAQQCRERKRTSQKGVSKHNPAKPSPRVIISSYFFPCAPSLNKSCSFPPNMACHHRPPDLPATWRPNMLFASPAASTPSSKSSKKHNATSKFSSCVGLTPPTCATRCWLHLLSSRAFAAILVAANESRCTVRFVAGRIRSSMHRRWM